MTYSTDTTAASNRQASEYTPLITLRLPDGYTDAAGRSEFFFQISDSSGSIVDDQITYRYLAGYMDNISGSMIPYSPYKYTIGIANNSVSSVVKELESINDGIQSLLDFINDNDGLRNCTISIKYKHRDTPELSTTGKYRVDRTLIGTEIITLELLAGISNTIPAICV